jgi:hypothetical protein
MKIEPGFDYSHVNVAQQDAPGVAPISKSLVGRGSRPANKFAPPILSPLLAWPLAQKLHSPDGQTSIRDPDHQLSTPRGDKMSFSGGVREN